MFLILEASVIYTRCICHSLCKSWLSVSAWASCIQRHCPGATILAQCRCCCYWCELFFSFPLALLVHCECLRHSSEWNFMPVGFTQRVEDKRSALDSMQLQLFFFALFAYTLLQWVHQPRMQLFYCSVVIIVDNIGSDCLNFFFYNSLWPHVPT